MISWKTVLTLTVAISRINHHNTTLITIEIQFI